jgi:autotransporter-associated beta strand protein
MFKLFNLGSSAERRHVLPALLLFLAAVLLSLDVAAATHIWSGGGSDNNWSTPGNWGGTVPMTGDDLVFPNGAAKLSNNNNLVGGAFNTITFSGPVGGYTISGNAIQLSNGITADNTGAGNTLAFAGITLTAGQTFTVSGDRLYLFAPINLGSNTLTLAIAASPFGIIELHGVISGAGGIIDNGSGVVFMSANCNYSGPTIINGGSFAVVGGSLNPAGTVTVSGGSLLQLINGASAGSVTVASGAILYLASGGTSEIGNVTDLTMQNGSTFDGGMYSANKYAQLVVSNSVTLNTPTLFLFWDPSYTSTPGTSFRIINKTSAGAITGTFSGQPEGSSFVSNGRTYTISYVGGSGNDVVVTDPSILPAILELLLD